MLLIFKRKFNEPTKDFNWAEGKCAFSERVLDEGQEMKTIEN